MPTVSRAIRFHRRALVLGLALAALIALLSSTSVRAADFLVTSEDDFGPGTLRAAITSSNAVPGPNVIRFDIPGCTNDACVIELESPLPTITRPVLIDGYTQRQSQTNKCARPNTLAVGSDAVLCIALTPKNGFNVNRAFQVGNGGGGTTIRGLLILDFTNNVIRFNAPGHGGNAVVGSWIGSIFGCGCVGSGVLIDGTSNNEIGRPAPADRNVIFGLAENGIEIKGNANNNLVRNNYIGTDPSGIVPIPNGESGVRIFGGTGNVVGGTDARDRNVIAGNFNQGVKIAAGADHRVQGNYIGVGADGSEPIGNGRNGVDIDVDSADVTGVLIGGTTPGAGNVVAFNGSDGVRVGLNANFDARDNAILRNAIHSNFDLGIDLDSSGVTANDADDSDTGPNKLQNFPEEVTAADGSVSGTLRSTPGTSFRIEAFANESCNAAPPKDHGEGSTFLGSSDVTLGASGAGVFTIQTPALIPGRIVTTTATELSGGPGSTPLSTSEFSRCVTATGSQVSQVSSSPSTVITVTPSEREKAKRLNNNTGDHDDRNTQGRVIEVRQEPPVIVILGAHGPVELVLMSDARDAVNWVRVGRYVTASGVKEHEGLYEIHDISIVR